MKRVRGAKMALRLGAWVCGRWQEDGVRVWGFCTLDFRIQLGKRKECSESFCNQNRQQRVDWFSHNSLLVFCHFCILPRFRHILNLQNRFVSEGATQNSSLSLWVSDTEVWRFIWSVSQPGSEDRLYLCSLAQSLSAFEQILYPPARRGWWHNNLCEPIFLPLLQ